MERAALIIVLIVCGYAGYSLFDIFRMSRGFPSQPLPQKANGFFETSLTKDVYKHYSAISVPDLSPQARIMLRAVKDF